ncbi:hypothetical protein CDAR_259731 [Caerostris darwini]|uniref:Uncharacterized protein n=1 Tax=Caerostris darwini TaxID=1538125 RepID=A0AAV4VMU6_9ARAC|nr:hypothetical protein CDAR_259731 [Caerostris darwini]
MQSAPPPPDCPSEWCDAQTLGVLIATGAFKQIIYKRGHRVCVRGMNHSQERSVLPVWWGGCQKERFVFGRTSIGMHESFARNEFCWPNKTAECS